MRTSTSRSLSLPVRVNQDQALIEKAMADPELAPLLARLGHDIAVLEQGRALCEQVRALQRTQELQYALRFDATSALKSARITAETNLTGLQELARLVFENEHGVGVALGLRSPGKVGLALWIERARRFYSNALAHPELLHRLARFNVTREQLEAGRQEVEALEQARRLQVSTHEQALKATRERDAAAAGLSRWMREFKVVIRAATVQHPQLRAAYGLRTR